MVEGQRDCEAILTQLMAARAALDRVGLLVAESFVQECLVSADGELSSKRLGRILEMVFSRFSVPASAETLSLDQPLESNTEE
jgi:DNA-binding FrmR family transcriptional regulator